MIVRNVIAKSTVVGRPTVTLSKSLTSDFYTVDAGKLGFLRTTDKPEAKDYYKACLSLQLE